MSGSNYYPSSYNQQYEDNSPSSLDIFFRVIGTITFILAFTGLIFAIVAHIKSRSNKEVIEHMTENINFILTSITSGTADIIAHTNSIQENAASIQTNIAPILTNAATILSNAGLIIVNAIGITNLEAIQGDKISFRTDTPPCNCTTSIPLPVDSCALIYGIDKLIGWFGFSTQLEHNCNAITNQWVSAGVDFFWTGTAAGAGCGQGQNYTTTDGCGVEWISSTVASGADSNGIYTFHPLQITNVAFISNGSIALACDPDQSFNIGIFLHNTEYFTDIPLSPSSFIGRSKFEFYTYLITGLQGSPSHIENTISIALPPSSYWTIGILDNTCNATVVKHWTIQVWQRTMGLDYSTHK